MPGPIYVGVDLETSGTDLGAGAVPIQLGMSLGAGPRATYSALIGWPFEESPRDGFSEDRREETWEAKDGTTWSTRSAQVHGIPVGVVRGVYWHGETPRAISLEAAKWLTENGNGGPRDFVAVGWNVGSFDFPFIRRYLPEVDGLFSYRFMDLNSVCFTLAQTGRQRVVKPDHALGFDAWKKRAKRAAADMIGGEERWHDAGYDALASLLAWYWLCDRLETRE